MISRRRTPQRLPAWAAALAATAILACADRPTSFSELDFGTARSLAPSATLVEILPRDAAELSPKGLSVRWLVASKGPIDPPRLPPGPVLVIAPTPVLGYRSAAALARSGNVAVHLVIVGSAEDRHTLLASAREPHAGEREEAPRDTDS